MYLHICVYTYTMVKESVLDFLEKVRTPRPKWFIR